MLVIAGARTADEESRLSAVTKELGFDPVLEPERLLAGSETSPRGDPIARNAKNVLVRIHPDRAVLDARVAGAIVHDLANEKTACGLAAFLEDLRERLLPILGA